MKDYLDEYELSFPIHVWNSILYENTNKITIDVYFNAEGFPHKILEMFGEDCIEEYRVNLASEIMMRNNKTNIPIEIWRISSDAFAIRHNEWNCGSFSMNYRGVIVRVLKKTILLAEESK